jgi:hypothetical protein
MIPDLQDATVVSVFGPVASGKTFLLKRWAEQMERVVVFDPTMEWADMPGFESFPFWIPERGPRAFAERMAEAEAKNEPYRFVVLPSVVEDAFTWTVNPVWQMSDPRWLIIEEIHLLMSPMYVHESMDKLNRFARKRLLGVIGSSQRIADVHKDFTSASRMSVLFHTTEPRDLDTIADRYGEDARASVSGMRSLAYDDSAETVSQTPQALVYKRGAGTEIIDVG